MEDKNRTHNGRLATIWKAFSSHYKGRLHCTLTDCKREGIPGYTTMYNFWVKNNFDPKHAPVLDVWWSYPDDEFIHMEEVLVKNAGLWDDEKHMKYGADGYNILDADGDFQRDDGKPRFQDSLAIQINDPVEFAEDGQCDCCKEKVNEANVQK